MKTQTEETTRKGWIALERKEELEGRLSDLNKRASRLGLPAVKVAFGAVEWRRECVRPGREEMRPFIFATVVGPDVHFDGWRVMAAIDLIDPAAGYVVIRSRHEERPGWRENAARCDHCLASRKRTKTVVIRHEDGREMTIGTDCLKDFVPSHSRDLDGMLSFHGMLLSLLDFDESESEGMNDGYGSPYMEPLGFLTMVAEIVLHHGGYVSRRMVEFSGRMTTMDEAFNQLENRRLTEAERITPTPEAVEFATAALAWAKALYPTSDYERNINTIARAGYCHRKHAAFLASIVPAYQRTLADKVREERRREAAAVSRHVGTVGEKVEVRVSLSKLLTLDGTYGTTLLHIFADESGNVLKWFCSGAAPDFPAGGELVTINGTVKEHVWRNGCAETSLTRVKLGGLKAAKGKGKGAAVEAAPR